jgi:ribonuclease HI
MSSPELLTIHTDGAARGNPGPAAYAFVIQRRGQPPIEEAGVLGDATNNQAEYTALVRALEHALALGPDHRIVVHSDSELMVKQLNGEYRVKNEELRPLYEDILDMRRQFTGGVTFVHVRRAQNKRADELCNEALDGKRSCTSEQKPTPASPTSTPETPAAARDDLASQAVALLRAAGTPSPEAVWKRLAQLLREHWLGQLGPGD